MLQKNGIRRLAYAAIMGALMIVLQVAMAPLPNIELVSFLVLAFTLYDARLARAAIAIFAVAEGLIFGFHLWWACYLYVWYVLHFVTLALRRWASPLFCAVLCGAFGLFFGTLCSVPYFFTLGPAGGFAWILSGLLFDIAHCIGNFCLALVLYTPVMRVLSHLPAPKTDSVGQSVVQDAKEAAAPNGHSPQ